ncbi:MAG: PH domain-containing protein [Anaerolineales bacterium]
MNFTPRRTFGFALGLLLLSLLAAGIALSIAQLGQGLISPISLVWIGLLLLALPLVVIVLNRLYGLATASYRVDRDGLYIRWGMSYEQIPLDKISEVGPLQGKRKADGSSGGDGAEPRSPSFGFWWPGCKVGRARSESGAVIDFFATSGPLLIIRGLTDRSIAISPPDTEAFQGAILSATRMGSLEAIPERSVRADFLVTRVWKDRLARSLILIGLLIPLLLLGALVIMAPSLPELVPFGFGPTGQPTPLVPPGRLLLLPMIAGLVWMADLVLGAWFFGNDADRPVAYALWSAAIAAGALLAGATWQLLSA